MEIARPSSPKEVSDLDAAHEKIPYTGRLLTCEFVFTYTADVEGPLGEVRNCVEGSREFLVASISELLANSSLTTGDHYCARRDCLLMECAARRWTVH